MFELSFLRFDVWWQREGGQGNPAPKIFEKVISTIRMLRDPNGINVSGRIMNAALQLAMHAVIDGFVKTNCDESAGGHILYTLNRVTV